MDLKLPEIGFGAAPLGGLLEHVDAEASKQTVDAALESGIRYFDTAPFYGFGLSERRVGDAVRDIEGILLSTKVGRLMRPGLPDVPLDYGWPSPLPFHPEFDYSYDGVMRSYEDSLQRLGMEGVNILFLHDIGILTHPDPEEEKRHFDAAMTGGYRALEELRRSGDVEGIGIGVNEIDVSLRALEQGDWDVFLLAGRYTLLEQNALDELFPRCTELGVKIVAGGPLNSGILAGGATWNYAEAPPEIKSRATNLERVCRAHGVPLPAAAIQFPLAHPIVETVIPGTRSPGELKEILEWSKLSIPGELWRELKSENLVRADAPTPS